MLKFFYNLTFKEGFVKKKFLVVLMFAAIAAAPLFSIDDDWYTKHSATLKDGGLLLNAGFALGWWGIGGVAAVDWVMPKTPFTLGGGIGLTFYEAAPGYDGISNSHVFIPLSFRFAWHPDLGVKNLDLYALATITPTISINSYPVPDGVDANLRPKYRKETKSGLWWASIIGVSAGARYYFAGNIGAFAELGYGIAPVSIGVTFKL
jgi:hypothetical protein